ncbi:recombinase family protein [Aquibacillus salsiterrae]|uniref:Recombinase family protein n=1 Tax=Aquibacillus salsiterrae TaxID=2950439 RepID=A0A9X4AG15_9BACI|nr:recombinase family protein [Aquibacillus salsiterrae]MDC3418481.1 recombinase family protein [Aquibacillus salsiterrae]
MNSTVKAVIYARVSTDEQVADGHSIEAQKQLLREYASQRKILIVDEYIEEGRSGKNIEGRPEMLRLLKDAKKDKFDAVITYKLDRLARKTRDSLDIVETLERHNVQLMSYSENIDTTTPGGKMFYTLLSSFAEMERSTIIDRVKMGMNQRAKQGKWNGGIVLGYNIIEKELVVNEEEAAIVQEIFDLANRGHGYKKIAYMLNEKGYKTKKSKDFSIATVKGILDNPIYIGKIRFNQHENWSEKRRKGKNNNPDIVDGMHTPIISKEIWEQVQQKRQQRSYQPSQSQQPYFLSRLIRCPECGHGMVSAKARGHKGRIYRYYQCGQFHNKGKSVCSPNSINADRAEQQSIEELKKVVTEPYFIEKLVEKMNAERADAERPLLKEKKRLLREIDKTDSRMDTIINKLMDEPELKGIFTKKLKEYQLLLESLQEKLESVVQQLKNISKEPIDANAMKHLLENLETMLEQADSAEKKELLALFVKDIQITKEPTSRRTGRQITQINLTFDFTIEALQGSTGVLLNKMNNININCVAPIDTSFMDEPFPNEETLRDALASLSILPLLMIRFPPINPKRSVHLLHQYQPH